MILTHALAFRFLDGASDTAGPPLVQKFAGYLPIGVFAAITGWSPDGTPAAAAYAPDRQFLHNVGRMMNI